jgi:hypothetical protein
LKCAICGGFLTTISATAPSIGDSLAQLISGGSGGPLTPAAKDTNSASSSTALSTAGAGPATVVTLSDQAKAAVAKAQSDQSAADRLQAYVERVQDYAAAQRVSSTGTKTAATDSLQSILDTNTQPTGTSPADAQPATESSKVEAIVAQIRTLADANEPRPFQPFTPTKSLSSSLTVNGYTLSLTTNASTQYYGIELTGNGVQAYSKHFGPSAGAGGDTALPPGVEVSGGIPGNSNEAIDAITIAQNLAMASSASISSSSAGSISASSVNAQSSSITFLVNYATGQIGVEQSAASVSARSTSAGSPGSTLSTLA